MTARRMAWAMWLLVMLAGGYANWSDEQARIDERTEIRDRLQAQYEADERAAREYYEQGARR